MTLLHSSVKCGVKAMCSTVKSFSVIFGIRYGFAKAIYPELPTVLANVTMYSSLRKL